MCIQSLWGQPDSVKEGVVSARMFLKSATPGSVHGIASFMLSWGRPGCEDLGHPCAAYGLLVAPAAVFPGYQTNHLQDRAA